ncbi:MAG: hypothetical protein V3V16_07625 [Melioribacteraceae bacterium]
MKSLNISANNLLSVIRYIARLFSILLIVLIVTLSIGEGLPNPVTLSTAEILLFVSLLIMLVGLVLSWQREHVGGLLIILGFILFFIVNSVSSGSLRLGFFFLLFPLTGILFVLCCRIDKRIIDTKK